MYYATPVAPPVTTPCTFLLSSLASSLRLLLSPVVLHHAPLDAPCANRSSTSSSGYLSPGTPTEGLLWTAIHCPVSKRRVVVSTTSGTRHNTRGQPDSEGP
ncbi:hypothetical protein B5X24_HaOG213982 [Helicoverpa armigera]|nr:hypothetical protein B5X24_HaOG213982 [Helicoverpa armigera]